MTVANPVSSLAISGSRQVSTSSSARHSWILQLCCQAVSRRLQPRHRCSITGFNLSHVPLQRICKGKTNQVKCFKRSWSCIVLHVCFCFCFFFLFLWAIFCRLVIIPLDEMRGPEVTLESVLLCWLVNVEHVITQTDTDIYQVTIKMTTGRTLIVLFRTLVLL